MQSKNFFIFFFIFLLIVSIVNASPLDESSTNISVDVGDDSQEDTSGESTSGGSTTCTGDWACTEWSDCISSGIQTRTCTTTNHCYSYKPPEQRTCEYFPEIILNETQEESVEPIVDNQTTAIIPDNNLDEESEEEKEVVYTTNYTLIFLFGVLFLMILVFINFKKQKKQQPKKTIEPIQEQQLDKETLDLLKRKEEINNHIKNISSTSIKDIKTIFKTKQELQQTVNELHNINQRLR